MLLFALKKCAFRAQMRQLVTHNMCNKNVTKMKGPHYWIELKYPYLKNPNFVVYKHFHFHPAREEEKVPVPRLMWYPTPSFAILKLIFYYSYIRFNIDKDFKLSEFKTGARQAVSVISNALAKQNYEILNNLVKERSLKLLKRRVDLLTPQQRKLLPIHLSNNYPFGFRVSDIQLKRTTVENEAIVEVTVLGYSERCDSKHKTQELGLLKRISEVSLIYIYVFQRKYINGIGGSWIVKLISYGDLNTLFREFVSE